MPTAFGSVLYVTQGIVKMVTPKNNLPRGEKRTSQNLPSVTRSGPNVPYFYSASTSSAVQSLSGPFLFIYLFIYLSRGIQFSRASLNGALTKHKKPRH